MIQIVTSENQTGTEQSEAGDQQAQNEEPQFVATAEMPSTSMENILETRLINLFVLLTVLRMTVCLFLQKMVYKFFLL